MDLHHSSCWEAILEKVKPHIPTMDFDSSSQSENEEIATIYQRPAGLSLTVSEDFDLLSMDDDHLERLWKPVAPTRRTEESEQLDGDENVEGSTVTQRQLADVEGDAPQTGLVESDASVRPNNTQTTTTTADQQLTVLSLARFDQWDLDDVLKNLDRLPLQQHVSVEPLETHADGDKEKSEAIIMERLVAFCDIQSSKNESEPMESPNHIKHTNVGEKSSGSLEDELRPRQKECPTVYIDLRCSDSSIKSPRTSPNPPSESKSPAKRSKHHETPKKVNLKVHHASCTDDREVTGKNKLLQKIREMKGNGDRYPNECMDPSHSVPENVLEKLNAAQPQAAESACGQETHKQGGDNQSSYVQFGYRMTEMETPPTSQQGPIKKPEQQSDQQRPEVKQTNAREQHQQIPEQLERHRPLKSKRNKDIHTPFYNHVCSFLTETSLPLIASWVPAVRNLLDQQAFASPIHLPSCSLNGFISTTSNQKVIDRTFGLDPGFYWQTLETPEHVCRGRETTQALHTEVSDAVGCEAFILHPVITHYTLQLVLDSGLDVCGLRLLYPTREFLSDRAGAGPVLQRAGATCQPVLALAVRGLRAHSVLSDLTSSSDPLVPGGTDPLEPPLFFSSRPASQVHRELCLWFSGRVSPYNRLPSRVVPSNERRGVFLCATTKMLAVCERRGFGLGGLQRLRLQSNGAADLRLSEQQARVFCIPRRGQLELLSPCLVLLLRKENAVHHTVCLPAALMREFKTPKLLGRIRSRVDGVRAAEPSLCFHTAPYSSNLYHVFVQCMWAVPDPSSVILSHPKSSSNSDMAILTFCGKDTRRGLSLLHRVLTEEPEGFQLLGLKWLPALTLLQARELNPYEVGQQLFQDSVGHLMPRPALVCALKRADALASLRKLLPQDYPGDLSVLMSPTLSDKPPCSSLSTR
uniref:Dynein axonemal assembly factor 8 n=1 Tax=Gasterosteus aculeatus aculeatus TaxID=481459 RepID=A0AAQ4QKN6_GASAC